MGRHTTLIALIILCTACTTTHHQENPTQRAAMTQVQLAREYMRLSNLRAAFDAVNMAIKTDGNYAEAHLVRAMILNDLKQTQEAEDSFQKALRYGSTQAEINHRYGQFLCINRAEPLKSLVFFERAFADPLYANRLDVLADMARCNINAGQWDAANQNLLTVLAIQENPNTLIMMIELQLQLQQVKLAQYYMNRLKMYTVTPSPAYLSARIRLARALGQTSDERYYMQELKQQFPHAHETQQLILEE